MKKNKLLTMAAFVSAIALCVLCGWIAEEKTKGTAKLVSDASFAKADTIDQILRYCWQISKDASCFGPASRIHTCNVHPGVAFTPSIVSTSR